MKKLILLSCLLVGINSYSQTTEEAEYLKQQEASINDDVYNSFTKEVIKFRTSEESLKQVYYSTNYTEKIGSVENSKNTCSLNEKDFEAWVSKNLSSTKFSNVEEAVEIFKNYHKYNRLTENKNREISIKLDEYKKKYGLLVDNVFRNSLAIGESYAMKRLFPNG